MLKRLYVNNYRCLVGFEAEFESFAVLCGANGSGKSSVFDALKLIRDLATGQSYLGGDGERDVPSLELTSWLGSSTQEFELTLVISGQTFEYRLHLEQSRPELKPRIVFERTVCDGRELYIRDLEGVRFQKTSGAQAGFPLDWRQAALGSIQPIGERRDIEALQRAIGNMIVLRPDPRGVEVDSKGEAKSPALHLGNLPSWYRYLSQEQEWTDSLRESLKDVWPDFRSFRLVELGRNVKALQLRFDGSTDLYLDQLSDGEKQLVGLYMVRAALATDRVQTVLMDEPDNYVGLPELQPWALSLRELLDENRQAILISHHPEILDASGQSAGRIFWRDNHHSPTRMGPLKVPDGLRPGEAIARGWAHG